MAHGVVMPEFKYRLFDSIKGEDAAIPVFKKIIIDYMVGNPKVEFISVLSQIIEMFPNFTYEQYKSALDISLPYFKEKI